MLLRAVEDPLPLGEDLLGVGIAVALSQIDETIGDPENVRDKLGLPLIGVLPLVKDNAPIEELDNPRSPLVAGYVAVQANLKLATSQGMPRSIAFTSTPRRSAHSSTPTGNDRYEVRYSGKALESRTALEKLLRKGVISLCGHETFGLSDVGVATETVMHRWKPEYRYVAAVADCSPQP